MSQVSLYLRINKGGKRAYVAADRKKQAKEGVYCLRYEVEGKRVWESVGESLNVALCALKDREIKFLKGELVSAAPKIHAAEKLTLAEQRTAFLELKELTKKPDGSRLDKETLSAYDQQVTEFLAVAKVGYAAEITGMHLRRYMAALEKRGDVHRTICNKYTAIATFLGFCGVDHKKLLPKGERPRPHDADPEAYSHSEVVRFLAAVSRYRDRLGFEFLLKTGAREKEMTHARWTDIGGGKSPVFKIQNHPETGFRVKTGRSRTVPLEKSLYEKLMMWKEQNPGTKLIFGTSGDKPDTHFLEVCKETARRAGLNCGECDGCKKSNSCEHWFLHKFRSTFATWALRYGHRDVAMVQGWMGHSSIAMTQRYLEKGKGDYAQEGINAAFGMSLEAAKSAAVM